MKLKDKWLSEEEREEGGKGVKYYGVKEVAGWKPNERIAHGNAMGM